MKKVKKETAGKIVIIGGILALFSSLLAFPGSKSSLELFISSLSIFSILLGIFVNRDYYNKTFYLAFLSLIIFQGLILIYTIIFAPVYAPKTIFLPDVGVFIFYILIFVYYYPKRRENLGMPWRG